MMVSSQRFYLRSLGDAMPARRHDLMRLIGERVQIVLAEFLLRGSENR
jgi:hypothetical protein